MTTTLARGITVIRRGLIKWLSIFKEGAFWYQIFAAVFGILLWIAFSELWDIPTSTIIILTTICFIPTSIVWAGLKKPYSCVIGTTIGSGLYNLIVGALGPYSHSPIETLGYIAQGLLYGFMFAYLAFILFCILGLIHMPGRRKPTKETLEEK